jgi:predicted lipoprotein with Yx(FWY)xxD motif
MRNGWWAAPILAAAVIGLAACGTTPSSTSSSPPAAPAASSSTNSSASSDLAAGIKIASIGGRAVLTDSQGFVLYWFGPDTSTTSMCTGSCATYWPPLVGTPSVAAGVTLSGKLGTIKRSDGTIQATYMNHPLYLYKSDSAGKDLGNGLNASGGYWWAMTASGAKIKKAAAPAPSTSTSSGSGGYGY